MLLIHITNFAIILLDRYKYIFVSIIDELNVTKMQDER